MGCWTSDNICGSRAAPLIKSCKCVRVNTQEQEGGKSERFQSKSKVTFNGQSLCVVLQAPNGKCFRVCVMLLSKSGPVWEIPPFHWRVYSWVSFAKMPGRLLDVDSRKATKSAIWWTVKAATFEATIPLLSAALECSSKFVHITPSCHHCPPKSDV